MQMTPVTKYRLVLIGFMLGLVLSGVTAFSLAREMEWLASWFGIDSSLPPGHYDGLRF